MWESDYLIRENKIVSKIFVCQLLKLYDWETIKILTMKIKLIIIDCPANH